MPNAVMASYAKKIGKPKEEVEGIFKKYETGLENKKGIKNYHALANYLTEKQLGLKNGEKK